MIVSVLILLCCQIQSYASDYVFTNITIDGNPRIPGTARPCSCTRCNADNPKITPHYENAAYNKPATASTIIGDYHKGCDAVNAVLGQCFGTADGDFYGWLRIDLETAFTFDLIRIIRRDLVNRDALSMLQIGVAVDSETCCNSPPYSDVESGNNFPLVWNCTCPRALTGRYVTMEKTERRDNLVYVGLHACHIEIWVCKPGFYGSFGRGCRPCPRVCYYACNNYYGCKRVLTNAALFKTALANPFIGEEYADHLLRGLLLRRLKFCTQFRPRDGSMPWFRVDMGHEFKVFTVKVTGTFSLETSLQNFTGAVSNSKVVRRFRRSEELCFYEEGIMPTRNLYACHRPVQGRYFFLATNHTELFFCRLDIYGFAVYVAPLLSSCQPFSNNRGCGDDNVCDNGTCKAKLMKTCHGKGSCTSGAICDLGKCRSELNQPCIPGQKGCKRGLSCDSTLRKCRIGLGQPCPNRQSKSCESNAACDWNLRCGREIGVQCNTSSECISGAQCQQGHCQCKDSVSTPLQDICKPVSGLIGSSCEANSDCRAGSCSRDQCDCGDLSIYAEDFSCRLNAGSDCTDASGLTCNTGLVCEAGRCKIAVGNDCYGNTEHCKTGTTCEKRICKLETGQNCEGNEDLCVSHALCSRGICQSKLGQPCQTHGRVEQCLSRHCSALDGNTCRIPSGERCTPETARFCTSGNVCDNEQICKLNKGQLCVFDLQCRSGTKCSSRGSVPNKKCRLTVSTGACSEDDDCIDNTVCDHQKQCRIAKGRPCEPSQALCVHGATCDFSYRCQCNGEVSQSHTPKCEAKPKEVGGQCNSSQKGEDKPCREVDAFCNNQNLCQCGQDLVPDQVNLQCRAEIGSQCMKKEYSPRCRTGSVCGIWNICVLEAGQLCEGQKAGLCRMGTFCDTDNICRLLLGENCGNGIKYCRLNTTCDLLKYCRRKAGERCRDDQDCPAGSSCSSDRTCVCLQGVSVRQGDSCVPVKGVAGGGCADKQCKDSKAVCNNAADRCYCRLGFTPDPVHLFCVKTVNQSCSKDRECVTGLLCDSTTKTCRVELGKPCKGLIQTLCQTGSVCDFDHVCRLDLDGNCTGANMGFCKRNTFCDKLDKCRYGVGVPCRGIGSTDGCVAGSYCQNDTCACDNAVSETDGAICEPVAGRYAASCGGLGTCDVKNSECVDGVCVCAAGFRPTQQFACEVNVAATASSNSLHFITGMLGATLGLVLIITLILLYRHRRQKTKLHMAISKQTKDLFEIAELKRSATSLSSLSSGKASQASAASQFSTTEHSEMTSAASGFSTTEHNELTSNHGSGSTLASIATDAQERSTVVDN